MPLIDVRELTKRYHVSERGRGLRGAVAGLFRRRTRTVEALAGVSFAVGEGELIGLIGPNGAGKSTLVKVLAGILVPDGGACTVAGRVPWLERIAHVRGIGVVFGQRPQLWWDLPVIESFHLLRDIYAVDRQAFRTRLDELVEALDIVALLDTPVRQLSLGQRMRCDIAGAMLHAPRILFLDEPSVGLDAQGKEALRLAIARLNRERGVTIILTTHDLDEIESLCRRLVVIDHGRVAFDGAIADLRRRLGRERLLTVETAEEIDLPTAPGVVVLAREGRRHRLSIDPSQTGVERYIARLAETCALHDLLIEHPPIESLVAKLYAPEAR